MRQLKDKITKAAHLFVKNEMKKNHIFKNVRHAKEMFNAFFNFCFDDMQYICRKNKNENGGEIRSITTSQDNISDIRKQPQVNL